jgi:hypothetical protein
MPAIFFYKVKYGLFELRKEMSLLPAIFLGMAVATGINLVAGS